MLPITIVVFIIEKKNLFLLNYISQKTLVVCEVIHNLSI